MTEKSHKRKVFEGSVSNLIRLFLSLAISLFLPHFLVRRMSPAEYGAWVLILQVSTYVTFLDLGVQTAIGKFVAEYDAIGDRAQLRNLLSSAFLLLSGAALCGLSLVAVLTWRVPQLFHQMPPWLWHEMRIGLLAVGCSIAVGLPLSVFGTAFIGLQQYGFPTILATVSRVLSTGTLVVLVLRHGSLAQLALILGAFNVLTALGNVWGWRRYARTRVPFTFPLIERAMLLRLGEYCGVLGIWTIGTLLISGLDTTVVGHYDYRNTGYYAVAASATNFLLVLLGNLLGPLMPAASYLGTRKTPAQMGALLLRATRYSVLLLLALALPLMVCGFPALRLWVGLDYAQHAIVYLRILLAANVIRYLVYTYTLMVVAAGKQRYASISPVAEAIVNLAASIGLARHYGAIGVALGTLIGSFVGVACHALISMRATQSVIRFHRADLLLSSVARPLLMLLPALLLFGQWRRQTAAFLPMPAPWLAAWLLSTGALGWSMALDRSERARLLGYIFHRISGIFAT